jgi:hypothetical protein
MRTWNILWTRNGYFEVPYAREDEEDTIKQIGMNVCN